MRYAFLTALLVLSHAVSAQSIFEKLDKFYVGGGGVLIDTNSGDINFTAVELLGGYKHSGYLGLDVRLGSGLTTENTTSGEVKVPFYGSVYWRTETANEVAKIYGLLGYSSVSLDVGEESGTESGFSYGGGVGFVFAEDWNLNFEYRFLVDNDEAEFVTITANVDYRF